MRPLLIGSWAPRFLIHKRVVMTDQPSPEDLKKWHRWFAVECNNAALELAEKTSRSEAESAQLLDAAHAAAFHWNQSGTELNVARARLLLA